MSHDIVGRLGPVQQDSIAVGGTVARRVGANVPRTAVLTLALALTLLAAPATAKTYEAIIDIPGRGSQRVTIEADDSFKARAMLESQYGRGNVRAVRSK